MIVIFSLLTLFFILFYSYHKIPFSVKVYCSENMKHLKTFLIVGLFQSKSRFLILGESFIYLFFID